ncbi:two-component system, OmpR family, sensor histidine kinase MtrB [Arthrobacter subterraneus]|uniref:Sensor histidine kinase MtrB n=1 Tax=Arthrobacter subterraneus TaxID=335973 RepID=A0A1G8BSI2_9MICC|nr:two-component system, OmpR family, sensor histidine kinase MtrB [Arthrobacter subterraneus]
MEVRAGQSLSSASQGAAQGWRWVRSVTAQVARRWRRSLLFRTVTSTLVLTAVALMAVGAFLSSQIANGLYQERLDQFKAEASAGLSEVREIFAQTSVTDRESTAQLVRDTLPSLEGGGADAPRQFMLKGVPGQESIFVSPFASPGLTESSAIPEALAEAVRNGDDQYWSPITLATSASGTEFNVPGIAFGTKVTLPPEQTEYSLYLIYDLSSMQATLDYIHGVTWIGGTLLLVTIGAIVWLVTRSVVGPVSHAALVSEKLAAGQLQERMETQGEDEVARLGASFNHMAASLQDQITQLAQLSQMQQRFVSDVSHELRTPLTTVRMAAEVLHDARQEFDPVNRRSAEILYNQVERFQALLADLLEISRFDAGAAVLDAEPTDIFQIVHHVIDGARPLAESHKSDITVISNESKCVVDVDPRRIDRILRNLVVNALEHGEGKPINIYIASNPDAVAVAVRDHGIGMTPLDAARVFDRFWRADPARARTTGGSGLGLSIATEDARLHGAWLQAWGSPGEGSCFRLTLPKRRDSVLKVSPLPLPPRQAALPPGPATATTTPDAVPTLHSAAGGER